MTEIEIAGVEVYGYHGVNDDERSRGQMFAFDVWLTVPQPERDDVSDTLDYREVRKIIDDVGTAKQYQLLETLAAAVADRIHADLQPERVRVRVRKQGITWAVYTAVTVERP